MCGATVVPWRRTVSTRSWSSVKSSVTVMNPSSFGSYTHPGPVGSRVTRVAATGGSTGGSRPGGFGLPTVAR